MALSYCPSFEQDCFIQTQLSATEDELTYFNDTFNYFSSDGFSNPLTEFDESLLYLTKDTYPKRQKTCPGDYSFFASPNALQIPAELPRFEAPAAGFCPGRSDDSGRKNGGGTLSAQSIAARERRRKITDKTKELGKLVPGGTKMNTAQMLSSAFDYVKFLQAQIQILQLNRFCTDEMETLVGSPKVQEKLYCEGKCLVPAELLSSAASGDGIQLKDPGLMDQIRLLLETNQQLINSSDYVLFVAD